MKTIDEVIAEAKTKDSALGAVKFVMVETGLSLKASKNFYDLNILGKQTTAITDNSKKEQFFAGCVYAILSNSNDFGVVVDEKQIINQAWKMAEMMMEKIENQIKQQ